MRLFQTGLSVSGLFLQFVGQGSGTCLMFGSAGLEAVLCGLFGFGGGGAQSLRRLRLVKILHGAEKDRLQHVALARGQYLQQDID